MDNKIPGYDMVEMAVNEKEKLHQINQDFLNKVEELIKNNQKEITLNIEDIYEKQFLEFLDKKLIGQSEAKIKLAKSLKRLSKLGKEEGVLATYFFAGPTGVGKTELAKLLSEFLTGNRNNLTIIQGAELQESHYKSKLFGAPPGYVGYGEDPILAETRLFKEKIKNPHPLIEGKENFQIILFDEAEKAHPDILQSLLGALNEGKVELQTGKESNVKARYSRVTNLKNTIWIFTSNIGSFEADKNNIGLISSKDEQKFTFKEQFEQYFSPEFRGRIDEFIVFQPLTDNEINQIIELQLIKEQENLKKFGYNISLKLGKDLIKLIKDKAEKKLGARNIVKLTEKVLSDKIAELNSLHYIETAHLLSLKHNKQIIFEFNLKPNHNNFQTFQDKVEVKLIIGDKILHEPGKAKEIQKTTSKYLDIIINPLEELISLRENNKNISALEALNSIKNDIGKHIVYREKYNNFQEHLKKIKIFIEENFGEEDWNILSLPGYIELVKNIVKNLNFTGELKDIIDPPKEIEMLSKLLEENKEIFISKMKNRIKLLKKKQYPTEIEKTISLLHLSGINTKNIKKKDLHIALITQNIENELFHKKEIFMGKERIENIVKYLISIY